MVYQSSEEYEALSTSDASEESSTDPFITSFGSSTRDYPPESELIATSADGSDIAVRLMFRGRIISGAGYEELVSEFGIMLFYSILQNLMAAM